MKPTKIISMGILAAASWIVDWLLLKQVIYQNQSIIFIGWPSLATILGITFLTFFFLINRNRIVSLILDLVIFAGYIIVMPKDVYVILGGVIFLIFLQMFEQRLAHDEKSRADFSIRRVMAGSMSLTVYAIMLLIALNIYYNTRVDFRANPDAYYNRLAKAATKAVPYIVDLPDPTFADAAAQASVDRIRQSVAGYERYFPFIFTIIITTTLLTFAFLLRWATMIISWIIFRGLLAVGFFRLHRVPVEVEKLEV